MLRPFRQPNLTVMIILFCKWVQTPTYCTRYFLCNYFQIAQADSDVDAYRSKQKAAEESEDKAIAEEIIAQFDGIVRQFLADHPDKAVREWLKLHYLPSAAR